MFRTVSSICVVSLALVAGTASASSAVRSFFSPSVEGDKIAFCTASSEVCGKPIADAWCAKKGFEQAILFQRDKFDQKTASNFVRFADNGEICQGDNCISFAQIKCYSAN